MASMTSLKADLGEYLREQRHSARLSLRQLADLAGVSNPYLSQIERGLKKPSAEILQQLAKGLRISAESLYVRAGILDEQDDRQLETKAAILADPLLAERQKRVLLDIYDAFCAENLRTSAPSEAAEAATDAAPGPTGPTPDDTSASDLTGAAISVEPDSDAVPGTGTADAATSPSGPAAPSRRPRTARTTRTTTPKGSR
jgi:transcriptional regulator with XRE-family HTH domain